MAFCKVCICGEKIVFAHCLSFPDNCPACGRKIADFMTYNEDELSAQQPKAVPTPAASTEGERPQTRQYVLRFEDGTEIVVPPEGGIIGRTEIGAESLAEYLSVSREHMRMIPRRDGMVMVEDISRYGTLIDGRRIKKNVPEYIPLGASVTMCNVNLQLTEKEVL